MLVAAIKISLVFFLIKKLFRKKDHIFHNITRNKAGKIRLLNIFSAGIYMVKFNNRNIRIRCEICSKLTIKIPELVSGIFINFEHISHLVLVFLLLTLNM